MCMVFRQHAKGGEEEWMELVKEVEQCYNQLAGNSLGAAKGGWGRRLASEQPGYGAERQTIS